MKPTSPSTRPAARTLSRAVATAVLTLAGASLSPSPGGAIAAEPAVGATTAPGTDAAPSAALAAQAAADPAVTLAAARVATERRDWAEALPRFQALERLRPADTDLLIESARVHGFADRNAEAAQRYRRVIELAPARRGHVLMSLAWQTLWSGDAQGAAGLFEAIARDPAAVAGGGDGFEAWRGLGEARQAQDDNEGALDAVRHAASLRPEDRAVRQRVAVLLGWLDRHEEAIAAWRALVADDPADRRSRYGLAQALNFAGRHRAALAEYRSSFEAARAAGEVVPNDARFDRARALRWAGFDELAHEALDGLPQRDAEWLRAWRTGRETLGWASAGFEVATDRDELDVRVTTAEAGWRPTPASSASLGLRLVDLSEPNRHASGEQLSASFRARLGPGPLAISSAGDPGPLWTSLTLAANRYGGWSPVTGAARLRWQPADTLRVDGELGREVIETPLAVSNRVTVDVAAIGLDWRWPPVSSVAGTLAALEFDDGNLRTRLNLRAGHAVLLKPRVVVGVEAMGFESSDPTTDERPARGYWNPRRYHEARAFVAMTHDAWPWDVHFKLGVGTARETDGWGNRSDGDPHVWELAVGYDLSKSLRLRAWAGGSGGSMGLGSGGEGYWRRVAGLSITGWF